jgi:hypothetical protein
MKTKRFNEERLRKYAEYLKAGDIKCQKLYTALVGKTVAGKVKDEKELKPLFFLPILEIPQVFTSE